MAFSASWVQRLLADRLKELRDLNHLKIAEVADAVGFSRVKLQRIERAEVRVEPRDVRKLCAVYHVADSGTQQLCDMAIESRMDIWWERFEQYLSPSYAEFIGYENDASRVATAQPALIPGLMQTVAYMRGLYAGSVMIQDEERIEALIEVRRLRQRRLTEQPKPLELFAVIGEAALRTPYGGREEFHTQLRYVRELLELPNVTIRVVTLASPVVIWPLELLEFTTGGPAVVASETLWGNVTYDTDREITQTRRVIDRVIAGTLDESESAVFIEKQIRETA